jgi:hypothetical protein
MLLSQPRLDVATFEQRTGWQLKPEGLCHDDVCIPFAFEGGSIDVIDLAERAHLPLVHDPDVGLWALGPPAGRALASATAPPLSLPDLDGRPFELASLRGTKVLLLAWASW